MKDRLYDDKICKTDIAVIGAGASGLMAAISAARAGASVTVLEHTSVSARKILATGNGRCNFTNSVMTEDCFHSDDNSLVMSVISRFSERDAVDFFEEIGVLAGSRNGYYYPRSMQASAIRNALIGEAARLRIRFLHKVKIQEVLPDDSLSKNGFKITCGEGKHVVLAKSCILATGGMAAPKTGSDGSGYTLARMLGHSVQAPLPALAPLISDDPRIPSLAGVRCDARVSLYIDRQTAAEDAGEVQFTDYGISGIPVFQVSRFAAVALEKKQSIVANIDFLPEMSEEQFSRAVEQIAAEYCREKSWHQILGGFCNQKIAEFLSGGLSPSNVPVCELTKKQFYKQESIIARRLKDTEIRIIGIRSFEQAQTTCGGVLLREISEDLQSVLVPGLFFSGEILNVDGICGGYNLQWAWASGFLAGKSAAESAKRTQ